MEIAAEMSYYMFKEAQITKNRPKKKHLAIIRLNIRRFSLTMRAKTCTI